MSRDEKDLPVPGEKARSETPAEEHHRKTQTDRNHEEALWRRRSPGVTRFRHSFLPSRLLRMKAPPIVPLRTLATTSMGMERAVRRERQSPKARASAMEKLSPTLGKATRWAKCQDLVAKPGSGVDRRSFTAIR